MQGALKKEHVAQRRIELTTPRFMKQQCLPLCRNQTKVFFYYILSSVKCHHVNNSLPNSPGTKIGFLLYEPLSTRPWTVSDQGQIRWSRENL